jgi:LuxR family quorum-sensing system transcriptional regulator CciR
MDRAFGSTAAEDYSRQLQTVSSYPELETLLRDLCAEMGFDHFVLRHEADVPKSVNLVDIIKMPDTIMQAIAEMRGEGEGPIRQIARHRASGFVLTPDRLPAQSEAHQTFFRKAYAAGGGDGYIIPANVPAGVSGWIGFWTMAGITFPWDVLPFAQYLGLLAYDASLRIAGAATPRAEAHPELTPRQIECIVHVGRGKGDWEIGRLLGISPETAHKHIQSAMKKFNVTTRIQLVVRALHARQVSLQSIIG